MFWNYIFYCVQHFPSTPFLFIYYLIYLDDSSVPHEAGYDAFTTGVGKSCSIILVKSSSL